MNNTIYFSDESVFESAINVLALEASPEYFGDDDNFTITSKEIDVIIDLLRTNNVTDFSTEYQNDAHESMDGDFDSGMASAGFGTDEDYGYFGGGEDE